MPESDNSFIPEPGCTETPKYDLQSLLLATRAIPWEADGDTLQFTFVGAQAQNILGYPIEKWYETDFWIQCIHPDDRDRVVNYCLSSSKISNNYDFEYRMVAADGSIVWFQDIVNVHRINGKIKSLRGFLLDITERRRTVVSLQESQRFRASLLKTLPGVVYRFGLSDNSPVEFISEGIMQISGYPSSVFIEDQIRWENLIHPEDRRYVKQEIKNALRKINRFDMEYRIITATGEQKWMWDRGAAVFAENGKIIAIEGFVTDITESKINKEAIIESEKEFRAIFELSAVSNTVVDVNSGRFVRVNKTFCELTGYSEEELLQLSYSDITPLKERKKDRLGFQRLLQSQRNTWLIEKQYEHKDGHTLWVVVNGKIIRDNNNQPTYAIATILDVTSRKLAEEDLLRNQKLLQQAQEIAKLGNWDWDLETNEILATEHMCHMYGLNPDETPFHVEQFIERIHPEDQEIVRNTIRQALTDHKAKHEFEYRLQIEDNIVHIIQIYALTEFDTNNTKPVRFFGTAQDITEQRYLEDKIGRLRLELEHQGRLACMGEFAASIAHELNQPLTALHSNAHTALRYLENIKVNHSELNNTLQDIASDSKRSGEIIKQLRGLTMGQEPVVERLEINDLVKKVMMLVNSEAILHRIDITVSYTDSPLVITACEVEIQHVLLNIIRNAFDAALNSNLKLKKIFIRIFKYSPDKIKISIRNNGQFVEQDIIDRMFDPFFTTKENGMGMGLSICKYIIEQHQGKIWVNANKANSGVTVSFTLPISTE